MRHANRHAPFHSDDLGTKAAPLRSQLLAAATRVLKIAVERRTGEASRGERNQIREFSQLLARNQTVARNFSIFDRAVAGGAKGHDDILRSARIHLSAARLSPRLRSDLEAAISSLQAQKVIANEDSEIFVNQEFANAIVNTYDPRPYATMRRRRVRCWY